MSLADSPTLSHDHYDIIHTLSGMLVQLDSDLPDTSAILACITLHCGVCSFCIINPLYTNEGHV